MPAPSQPPVTASVVRDVTCPFCGLACDDLVVETTGDRLVVRENGCPIAVPAFAGAPGRGTARLGAREVPLAEAYAEAARLLRAAKAPLFGGLGTDVRGSRAVGRLADRTGATLDHMNSAAAVRNLLVLQDGGWITTTLSEIRNHCDLLVAVGGDIVSRFPRFFERTLGAADTLFGARAPVEILFLGTGPAAGVKLPGPVRVIPCETARLGEALGALRALVAGKPVAAAEIAGQPLATWQELAGKLRAARYGVMPWATADMDVPHADLTVQALADLLRELNRETRFAGLPLGGAEGDVTSDAVHLWQTGYGTRVSFARGVPEQDLHRYATPRLLAEGAVDLLLWISSFNPARVPPKAAVPTVVLGHAVMTFAEPPAVFIPVGTPGVDHGGQFFRTDRVVALPLAGLRASSLPSVADALAAIEALLGEAR